MPMTMTPMQGRRIPTRSVSPQRYLGAIFAVATVLAAAVARAERAPLLHIEPQANGFALRIAGALVGESWVLQHSREGRTWNDVLFLDGSGEWIAIPTAILTDPDGGTGLFRAVQLAADDPLLRRFLAERAKWRLSGIDSYAFEFMQSSGPIFWHGAVTVTDGAVVSSETIEIYPPFFEAPEAPTIDRLFERIASAIANDAETIDVTWHPVYGFPGTCFIDLSALIADEEQSWSVDAFVPQ